MKKNKIILKIIIVYLILLFMTAMPLILRTIIQNMFVVRIITYLLMFGLVFVFCKKNKVTTKELGYNKKNISKQLLKSLIPLFISVSIFVVFPLIFGVNKEMVLSTGSTNTIEIIEQICFLIIFVGPVEEFIFRGYFESEISKITNKGILISLISSILFGFWHFPSTMNLINVICTFFIGLIYSISKKKLKNCSTLSISIAHGLHDTIIFILGCILL